MTVLGVDIGGANIKVSDSTGTSRSLPFPMWIKHASLAESLKLLLQSYPQMTERAVTMTGELADCFETRHEGVSRILDQVERVFDANCTWVYAVGDRWLSPSQAREEAWSVAASNWYALATWLGRCVNPLDRERSEPLLPHLQLDHLDLVIDIGSTTVDIIPMHQNQGGAYVPATLARTDRQRLQLGQLVYTGMQRTPVAAIVSELDINGERCPVMAERFATSDDCYIAVGAVPEVPEDCDTADGRPRTRRCALSRLARMVGEDHDTLKEQVIVEIANQVITAQAERVAEAIARNLPSDTTNCGIVIAGHGRPLASRALALVANDDPKFSRLSHVRWLDQIVSPEVARSAPATAVAVLRSFSSKGQVF